MTGKGLRQPYYDSPFCDVTCRKYYHLLLNKVCRVAANRLLKVTRIKIPGDILTLSDISNERSFRFKVTNITTFGKLYNETGIASRRPKSEQFKTKHGNIISYPTCVQTVSFIAE